MANMVTLAITEEQFERLIWTLEHGFVHNGVAHRANPRVAFAARLEHALAIRVSDVVKLCKKDIVKDGDHFRLDIVEKKTGKKRTFRISNQIYDCISGFCEEYNIADDVPIIGGTTYRIQKVLKQVGEFLGFERFSTHSLRKSCCMNVYEALNYDIEATRRFMNHSSSAVTSRYLNSCDRKLDALLDTMTL